MRRIKAGEEEEERSEREEIRRENHHLTVNDKAMQKKMNVPDVHLCRYSPLLLTPLLLICSPPPHVPDHLLRTLSTGEKLREKEKAADRCGRRRKRRRSHGTETKRVV